MDKIERYKWTVKDRPGRLEMINKNVLKVDEAYQRHATIGKVRNIASEWSWVACGAIIVGLRNGEYWVIDGQHRVLAAFRRPDITHLPCIVFDSEGQQQEAQSFLDVNTNRKSMTSVSKAKALAVAGNAAAEIFFQACADFDIQVVETANAPGSMKSAAWGLDKAAQNPDAMRLVLGLAAEISRTDGIVIKQKLLDGLWVLHLHCGDGLNDSRLAKRIREKGAIALNNAAARASAFYSRGSARIWAIGMLEEINKGLRRKFTMETSE